MRFSRVFLWQLVGRVGEDMFAQGVAPTEAERDRRSERRLGEMVVFGDLMFLVPTAVTPLAWLAWVATGRGPGQRWLAYSAGGPRVGSVLVARVGASVRNGDLS